jgi:predicted DNA-binding protein
LFALPAGACRLFVYMGTTTIRVAEETRDKLNELARRRGEPAGDVVAALVEEADDRALLSAAFEDWQRLNADEPAAAAYRAETGALDAFDAPLPDY